MSAFTKFAKTFNTFVRSPWSSKVFLPARRKPTQGCCLASAISQPPTDAARRGVEEVKKAGSQIKEQVASHAENMASQSKDAAGKVTGVAENIAEKAKKTAQGAWNVAKEKAQEVKENVSEKTEEVVTAAKRKIN